MGTGRRTRAEMMAVDTTPGKILAMAILANVPIAAAFVLVPLFAGGDPQASRPLIPFVMWLVPPLAMGSTFVYFRAPKDRRAHRAARIGIVLAFVALALWVFMLASIARVA